MQATQTVNARTPRRYASRAATQAENANRPRYIVTFFRNLDVSAMNICVPKIERGVITLIESFPRYRPDYALLIDTGQESTIETNIQAIDQVETLTSAFGVEGLTVLNATPDEIDEIAEAIAGVEVKDLASTLIQVNNANIRQAVKDQLLVSIRKATTHANNVLTETRREIQNSRTGKAGKNYLDDRDLNACKLLSIPESAILSSEGEASNSSMEKLANKLAAAITENKSVASSESTTSVELLAAVKELSEQNKALKADLESLKKKVK